MRARIRHRGPDQGSTDAFGACVLGHQRLQVIDPELGYQPVANERGDVIAVFNGELYNFPELRRELAEKGHDVRGRGDTPVIPHLYEEYGPRFVERLEGMFAVALWDARAGRLVLARDRLGKKPLVWTRLDDGTLAFASELKALLALPHLRREPDLVALDAYLALQYVPGTRTGLRGVQRLAPASVLVADGERRDRRAVLVSGRRDGAARGRALARARARDGERRGPRAARRRRAARRAPVGRDRLGRRRRTDGGGVERTGADVHRRVHGRAIRRARVRARRRRALRDAARGDRARARRRGDAAAARGRVRRAARRRGRAAALPHLRGGAAGGHRRPRRRRRRRVVRRLRAIPRHGARRARPGGDGVDGGPAPARRARREARAAVARSSARRASSRPPPSRARSGTGSSCRC